MRFSQECGNPQIHSFLFDYAGENEPAQNAALSRPTCRDQKLPHQKGVLLWPPVSYFLLLPFNGSHP